jgi:hypothetical protein
MSVLMIIQVVPLSLGIINLLVYCSYKRNNVNILFEHANSTSPFELTRIVVKVISMLRSTNPDTLDWLFIARQGRSSLYFHVTHFI